MMTLKDGYLEPETKQTKRFCQFLRLKADCLEQYKYWHNSKNVWAEIPKGIRKAGILNMEIYIVNDLSFMIIETPIDFVWDEAFGRLATYERQAEWEDFVAKYQGVNQGKKSEEKWQLIERVFSLEEALKNDL